MYELGKDKYQPVHGNDIDAQYYSQTESKPQTTTSTVPAGNVNCIPKVEKHDTNGNYIQLVVY